MSVMNIMKAFQARHSSRTFNHANFTDQHREILEKAIQESNALKTPFGSNVEIGNHPPGLGRFGAISDESGWLIGKIPKDAPSKDQAQIDAAFKMHNIVMRTTQAGINSVWVSGTYNEGLAEEHNPGFIVPFAVAYGIEEKPHFMARFLTSFSSKGRKPLEELFYDADAKAPITEESARAEFCHALQSGPSALNKQPWRFVFEQGKLHLFQDGGYPADMGIAMAAIKLLLENENKEAKFTVLDAAPSSPFNGAKYVMTADL